MILVSHGRRWRAGAALAILLAGAAAASTADKEADLKEVKARIEAVRRKLAAETEQRNDLVAQLKSAELDIQDKRRVLAAAREQRQTSERQLHELRRELTRAEQRIADERAQLARAVRAAYMGGRAEQLKLALNQQDPSQIDRMLTYYRYLGAARAARLAAIREHQAHLQLLTEQVEAQTVRFKQAEQELAGKMQDLTQARRARQQRLAEVQTSLQSRGGELKRLQSEAAGLERLISELGRALQDFPALAAQPFQKVQGRLPWPVNGKLLARFGAPRAGGLLKWQGVVIGAPSGAQVRAPFHGRVVYADWLNGFGLLVMLDHGGGYRSIYGRLEELYCKVGDTVAPGHPLGAVAEQGAEGASGLYLEIRRGAQPEDPRKWLSKP